MIKGTVTVLGVVVLGACGGGASPEEGARRSELRVVPAALGTDQERHGALSGAEGAVAGRVEADLRLGSGIERCPTGRADGCGSTRSPCLSVSPPATRRRTARCGTWNCTGNELW